MHRRCSINKQQSPSMSGSVPEQGGGGAGEGRERGAGGGRDGPWATQGMSMGYARACVKQSLSLSLSLSLAFSCSCCALSHNAQTRTQSPTPTPNITPTLVQRAGMPRFLRKPFSGEQGTRQGSITSLPPLPSTHKSTRLPRAHARIQAHTYAYAYGGQGTREGSIIPPPTPTQML